MRSSSMAGERGAAGPGYTKKKTHTQQNKTTGVWASWCEHSLNGVDRLLKTILMSSSDSWWQNLRIHLVKSSLKTVPDNRMSLNPLWTMQTCKFHWTVQPKKLCFPEVKLLTWNANCNQWQTKSRCFFLLINPTKCNGTTIESSKLIWVSFRHRIVDLIQWSVVLSTLTLKSPSKTCGKYLIRTCNAKDFTNRLSLTSFQTHGTCSTIRKLLHVVVS